MKKLLAIITAAFLLLISASSAFAATVNLTPIRSATESIFDLDVNKEADVAFITTQLDVASRSFTHKNPSSHRYSYTEFDILVMDYSKPSKSVPLLRLWVVYNSDVNYLYINSVSFDVNGTRYTFTDVSDYDRYTHDDKGYRESVLIKFDLSNIDFLIALEKAMPKLGTFETVDALDNLPITMILHGTEDIVIPLDSGFCLDFLVMKDALIDINGLDFFGQDLIDATPMTVR